MPFRRTWAAVIVTVFGPLLGAADPPKAGEVTWADKYPKAVAADGDKKSGIKVFGTAKASPGWKVTAAKVDYAPVAGGTLTRAGELAVLDGKWGTVTTDNKGVKAVAPARIPVPSGKWNVFVTILFEGTDETGARTVVPYNPGLREVEVR